MWPWLLIIFVTFANSDPLSFVYSSNCEVEAQSALLRALHHINSIPCSGLRFQYVRDIPVNTINNEFTNVVFCNANLTPPVLGLINMRVIQPFAFKLYVDRTVNGIALMNVMMHEIGHAAGLEHINSSTSIMRATLNHTALEIYSEAEKTQIALKHWNCPQISNGRLG